MRFTDNHLFPKEAAEGDEEIRYVIMVISVMAITACLLGSVAMASRCRTGTENFTDTTTSQLNLLVMAKKTWRKVIIGISDSQLSPGDF